MRFIFLLLLTQVCFADSIFLNVNSNNDTLSHQLKLELINEILDTDHSFSNDRYESDWVFDIEVIESREILYSYIIYIDSRSRNIFYEEYITHTWVSFYPENFQRPANHFMEYFREIISNE